MQCFIRKEYVQYLVLVITAPGKKDIRSLIRNEGYWAYNWTDSEGVPINWKHYFVVGEHGCNIVLLSSSNKTYPLKEQTG